METANRIAEKLSRYVTVSEHVYRTVDGAPVSVLYSARTGSAACVPEPVMRALRAGTFAEIDDQSLAELRAIEALVGDTDDERTTVLNRQRKASQALDELRFVLFPTRYCNMGCSYCGQEHTRGPLGRDHRDAVLARVLAGIDAPGTSTVAVRWFGAEPMVGYPVIRSLSKRFIAAADDKGVTYHSRMVTNGTLLTVERLRILAEECRVLYYDITIDGPERIHNTHRPMKSGQPSFTHIVSTVKEALSDPQLTDIAFTLRTNIDVENASWVDEYLDQMADLGFADDRVTFNLAPVYPWGNDVSGVEIPRRSYAVRETEWMARMHTLGLRFHALPGAPVGQVCAAVTRSAEIVSGTGNLFSCSEYPLVPQHEATGGLGKITELPVAERRPLGPFDDWHDAIAAGETPCHGCTIMPVCGGACPKQWREGNVPCPPTKYTMQERLDLVATMSGLEVAS